MIGDVFSASVPRRGMQTVWLGVCHYSQIEKNLMLPLLMSVKSGSCMSLHMIAHGSIQCRTEKHLVTFE